MKVILAFAILALASAAVTPAYFQGFTTQIGLNPEQMKHGEVCFNSLRQVMMDIHRVVQSKEVGISEVLRSAIVLIEDVENKLKIDCSIYLHDVMATFWKSTKPAEFEALARRNWNTYGPEIIQQIAMYFDYVIAGQEFEAGRTEAYIYQILMGTAQPNVLQNRRLDYNKMVQMNITKYVNEFTRAYYETLGLNNNKAIKDNVECTFAQLTFFERMNKAQRELETSRNSTEWLHAFEKQIHEIIALHDACVDAISFNIANIVVPIASAFKYAPVHATLAVVHNVALHLPELKHNYIEMILDLQEGQYSEAGKNYAKQLMTVIKNIW